MTAKTERTEDGVILYDDALLDHAELGLFEPPAAADAAVGGRGAAWMFKRGKDEWVLRHYRRGGVPGRFVRDRYLWIGLDTSRPWWEWRLLDALYREGLPVPQPVAARVQRTGFLYRGDLITRRIPATRNLAECLTSGGEIPWVAVGRCLRRFHDAGVCHADLNAHNILLDESGRVYLIDFDRGIRRGAGAWRGANLSRLKRSLDKLSGESGANLKAWGALLEGYGRLG
ncbi:MAG TPA: 3-deoxy-D-manno-octulosonic acid kinase [Gammaproteobacteria bacterium]|jgi:3-deoxy-D-manno-octulosonic acid kinase